MLLKIDLLNEYGGGSSTGIGQALSSSGDRKRGPVELVFLGASKKALSKEQERIH